MSQEDFSALKAFAGNQGYFEQSPTTVSLADTSLLTPSTPGSYRSSSVTPSQSQGDKKPVKKRKSWGQELPTPKTNLPPRKRAKTEDEKEQRRIERVLRNRAAAQSSRERKRQEVERLEGEKCNIEVHNRMLKQRLLAVEHDRFLLRQEVIRLRTLLGQPTDAASMASQNFMAFQHQQQQKHFQQQQHQLQQAIKREREDYYAMTPESAHTVDPRSSLASPSSSVSRSPSPCRSEFHGAASVSARTPRATASVDMTQHPAVSVHGSVGSSASAHAASRRSSVSVSLTSASTCESSPVQDAAFGRLFSGPESDEPSISFFEEGLAVSAHAGADAGGFPFDSLVDLDGSEDNNKQSAADAADFIDFDFGTHGGQHLSANGAAAGTCAAESDRDVDGSAVLVDFAH